MSFQASFVSFQGGLLPSPRGETIDSLRSSQHFARIFIANQGFSVRTANRHDWDPWYRCFWVEVSHRLEEIQHFCNFIWPYYPSLHLKIDSWNTSFLLGWLIFRCELLVLGRVNLILQELRVASPIPRVGSEELQVAFLLKLPSLKPTFIRGGPRIPVISGVIYGAPASRVK